MSELNWPKELQELTRIARLQHLIRQHTPEIAQSIVLEQGKTFADAQGDVQRGLQVSSPRIAMYHLVDFYVGCGIRNSYYFDFDGRQTSGC